MRNARSSHLLPSLRLFGLVGAIWSGLSACDAPPAATPPPPDAGEAGVSACQDPDEDGFGPGCEAGFDCAPEDPEVGNECLGCTRPETGCPCDEGAEAIDCVLDPVELGDVTMCYAGLRHCRDGVWSACAALRSYTLPPSAPNASSGAAIESLVSGPEACPNPCDPLCRVSRDTPGPGDITPGSGLTYTPTPGGITLEVDPSSSTPTLPDADGDGVPDAYDSAPTNPAVTGHESGFFAVLPYGTTATRSRDIATTVRTVDVYFLVDTTGSMGGEIANLRSSLSGTIIPGIRAAIPDAWFGVGRHDDYPVSPYGGAAYGDRVFQHLQDITGDTVLAQNAVNGLATRWGNDLPESQTQALWAVATGGGIGTYLTASSGIGRNAGGTVVTSGIARTGCPATRWGYPCFREGTIPIIILVTDVGYHNGPFTGWDYAGTAGGILAPGPAQVVPAPFFPVPAPTAISHRMSYPLPTPPTDVSHWEGWTPGSPAPVSHVTAYDAPATATGVTHASLIGVPTPPTPITHATGGSTAPLPGSSSRFAHVTTSVPTDIGRGVTHGTSATYSPTSSTPVVHATLTPSGSGSSRSVTHRTSVTYPAPPVTPVTHGGATFPLPGAVTPVSHALAPPSLAITGSAGGGYVALPARATAVALSATAFNGGERIDSACGFGGPGCAAPLGDITGSAVSRRYTGLTSTINHHSVGCVPGNRRDAVFSFTLTREEVVRVRAYHYHRLVVGLYRQATGPSLGNRYGCSQAPGGSSPFPSVGAPAEIIAALPAGTYYLVVEPMLATPEAGTVASNLDLDIQTARLGTFDAAYPGGDLSPSGGDRELRVMGGNTSQFPNFRGSFGGVAPRTFGERTDLLFTPSSNWLGPDQYVSFTLSSPREVTITATPTVGSFDIAFSLYNSAGSLLTWRDGPGSGVAESTNIALGAGTYFVNIDGYSSGSFGTWDLTVQPQRRRYDLPDDPYPAGDVTNLGASFSGSTSGLANNDTAFSGPDAYYSFTLSAARTMRVSLESGPARDTALRVYNSGWGLVGSNDDRHEFSGRSGLNVALGAGTYYVVVDGYGGSSGNYVLDLQPEPPRLGVGDTRTAPVDLGNLSNSSWSGTGHTFDVGGESSTTCGAGGRGRDAFYRFTLDGPRTVRASTIRSTGMTFDTVVQLMDAAGTSIVCNDDASGSLSSVTASLGAGTYTVVVDGYSSGGGGNYRLDLEVTRPVLGDVESNAVDVGDLTTRNVSFSAGNSCDLNNDYDLSSVGCGATPGDDAVYRFVLTANRRITANVSAIGGGAGRFVVRRDSVSGTTMSATSGATCGTSAGTLAWDLTGTTAGTVYYLIVDTTSPGICGNYTLSLDSSVNTVVGDTLLAPFELPAPDLTNQDRTWMASTTCDLAHNVTPSCSLGSSARDAYYAFTLFADRRVTLTLNNIAGLVSPVLAIVNAAGAELSGPAACATGASSATITRELTGSPGGTTYYAVVDSTSSGNCGSYTLSYAAVAVSRVGDTTTAPTNLGSLDSTGVSASATQMCELRDDLVASCGGAGAGSGSRDAVYAFTLSQPRTLSVTLSGTSFTPAMTIRRAGAPTVELPTTTGTTCVTAGTSQWAIDPGGFAQTYYLVVEGGGASCNNYSLSITSTGITSRVGDTIASPVPVGDLTSSSVLYTSGSTCDLLDQFQSCGGLSPAVPSGGRDAYYSFSLSAARDVTVTLTPTTPSFDATFHLLDAGGVAYAASPTCANAGGAGSVESRTFRGLPGGSYYVVVDSGPGAPASCGSYTLGLRTNATSVEGDTYTNARNAGTLVTAAGAPTAVWVRAAGLCSIGDDIASSCSTAGVGREDGVYRFRLDAPSRVTVNVRDPAAPWTQALPATSPGTRNSFAIAYDLARGQVVLFGGNVSGTASNETWLWDGTNWTLTAPATRPPARFGHAMAYDSSRGLVFMYGGTASDGSASFDDTWVWDGVNWSQATPTTRPAGRRDHAMAFDPNLNQIVLFGGRVNDTSPSLLQTWVWDGANWQTRATSGPAARHLHAMAYDATSGLVMMFGGQGATLLDDTWVWNGTGWVARTPATRPPARNAHAMAYDAIRRQVVLFGGFGGTYLDDLWLWNGTNWVANTTAPRPSARNSHAMAFDELRSQVVVFGGGGGSPYTYRSDTWLWNGAAFDPVVSIRDLAFNEVPGVTGASCVNAAGPGTGETITATLPIGTYYAVVDSADGSCGTYDLQIQPQTLGSVIGDTQADAIPLPNLTAASTSYRGTSTCDLTDHFTSACSSAGPARRDAVYRFRIDAARRVLATLTPLTTGFNAVLELRDSSFALVTPCVDGAGAGLAETLSVASLPTGDYFLVIDSDDGSCGDYQIDVQTGSPSGIGDTYGTAIPSGGLDLTSMGASYMASSTCDLAHDVAPPSCGAAGVAGRDAVYQFTLTAPRIVTARLTGLSAGFDGVLSIRTLAGAEVAGACSNTGGAGVNESITTTLPGSLGGTTYYVVVDSNTPAGCGDYRVELSSAAVLGDTLTTAITASLSSGAASVSGNTATPSGLTNDTMTPCATGSGGGVDAFYRFQVPDARRVTLTARGTTWDLALGLRTATAILGCSATGVPGAVQTVVADLMPGVDYYVQIDGRVAGAAGAYQLDIATARVRGDTISTAIPAGNLTMASASFAGIGSGTAGLANDLDTCGGVGNGPDAFYAFSITAPRRVTVRLTPVAGYNASLAIRDGAGAVVSGTCTNANPAGVAETWTGILPSGDYTVQVDGAGGSAGRFQLDLESRSDLGDVWLDPVDAGNMTGRSESYTGTTVGLSNDDVPSCGLAGSPDAYYRFFLTQPTFVQIDTFGSGTDTVLALYDATSGGVLGCNDNTGAGTESSLAGSLAAGTYMVLVEHRSTAGAAYRLNFRTRTPDNERIANPFNVGNLTAASANVDGSTCQMASDFSNVDRTCGTTGSGTGGDTVFTFTLDTTRSVIIDTVGSEFDTVLRLTNASGGDIACDDNGGGGAGTSRISQTLAAGTYYVILDSFGNTCGNYHLNFDVVGGTSSGFPTIPWGSAVSALNARDIDVIVVSSMGTALSGFYDTRARTDADALCDLTGTVRSVASCPTGQTLCTVGGVANAGCCSGGALRGSSTRYRYDISDTGTGLGSTVVEAVQNLSQYRRLDITAVARDNTATVGFDERTFVSSITAVSFPAGRCTGISGGTRFLGCLPGTTVNFRANFIGAVMPTMVTQVFTFNIEVLGDDSIVLAVVPVTIVVPPMAPLYPSSATYTRDFDGDAGCPAGSTALPVWRDLRWTATLPAGTSIGWTVRSATTLAALASAGPATFTTPSEVSPVMLQARLMGSGQPTNARYLRVSATLNPSAAGDVAPTLTNMEVTWSCLPSE